jgi:hypothetical protein
MTIILAFGLLLLLPQLAGLLIMRLAPRASWAAWPAAAIFVFGLAFYGTLWAPARASAEAAHYALWELVAGAGFRPAARTVRSPRRRRPVRIAGAPPAPIETS